MSFTDFVESPPGAMIAPLLDDPAVIARMEALSIEGKPAVAALDAALPSSVALSDTERQYVGRWIKEKLAARGWRTVRQRRFGGGRVFTSGTVYARPRPLPPPDGPVHDMAAQRTVAERVAAAQAIIRRSGLGDYGVDDYLKDKWAEAEAEELRMTERYGKPA